MIKRTIRLHIIESLDLYPVVVITGPQQVGKLTVVMSIKEEYGFNYVSLDDIDNRSQALADPKLFTQFHGYPLIIDEIQYAPILLEVIESIVNEARMSEEKSTGLFILTGSQTFQMMKGVSHSLTGRATIIEMSCLSLNEIHETKEVPFKVNEDLLKKQYQFSDVNEVFKNIYKGGYPELYNRSNHNIEKYYSNYVNTYIDRDVVELINIKDRLKFHNFMQILASLTGQQLNYASISKEVEVAVSTVKEWVSVLKASGLIILLQPYNDSSIKKRVIKSPKVYFTDTGLACFLIRIKDYETLMVSNMAGAFMETMVVNEIRKSYINNNLQFDACYSSLIIH